MSQNKRKHEGKYLCDEENCQKKFTTEWGLSSHQNLVHKEVTECHKCHELFKNHLSLGKHQKTCAGLSISQPEEASFSSFPSTLWNEIDEQEETLKLWEIAGISEDVEGSQETTVQELETEAESGDESICVCGCLNQSLHLEPMQKNREQKNVQEEVDNFAEFIIKVQKEPYQIYKNKEHQILSEFLADHQTLTVEAIEDLLKILKNPDLDKKNFPESYPQMAVEEKKWLQVYKKSIVFKSPRLKFFHIPLMVTVQSWLLDIQRFQKMKFTFQPKQMTIQDTTQRVYADIWDSDWMKERQQNFLRKGILNAKIIPLIIWSDATLVTRFSQQQMHPILVSCGSDPLDFRDSEFGKSLVGYIPSLFKIPNVKGGNLPRYRLHLFQTCLWIMLEDLEVVEKEGMWFKVPKEDGSFGIDLFFPLICCYLGDIPELKKVAMMFSGGNDISQQTPCWSCNIPGNQLNNIKFEQLPGWKKYQREDVGEKIQQLTQVKNVKAEYEALCKKFSMYLEKSMLMEIPYFCISTDLPSDIDHNLPFGIGLFMVDNFEVLLEQQFPENKTSISQEVSQKLDRLVFEILEVPSKMMPRTFVFGMVQGEKTIQKYKTILAHLPFVLKRYFQKYETRYGPKGLDISRCFALYARIQRQVYHDHFSDGKLEALSNLIENFQQLLKELYGSISKTGFCTIKFHKMGEMVSQIKRFGRLKNTNTGRYETGHQKFVKKIYLETNKQTEVMVEQMIKKITQECQSRLTFPKQINLCSKIPTELKRKTMTVTEMDRKLEPEGFLVQLEKHLMDQQITISKTSLANFQIHIIPEFQISEKFDLPFLMKSEIKSMLLKESSQKK